MIRPDIDRYIRDNWQRTIHRGDGGHSDMHALPHPYTVPCIDGHFQAFFYWDTYFTNLGLIRHGLLEQARCNAENMFHLIDRWGFVLNHTWKLEENRSQPPYLAMMVRELDAAAPDEAWLGRAHDYLLREYQWWMTERMTPLGLNRHFQSATEARLEHFYDKAVTVRLGLHASSREEKLASAVHHLAEAETGWDFNPRFERRCADFAAVDLNSNLFVYEQNLAWSCQKLGRPGAEQLLAAAERRRQLMERYFWNEERGLFLDYDFVNARQTTVASLASFHPLWAGVATPAQAERVARNLGLFEREHGIAVCAESSQALSMQWDYPNMWPPLVYTTVSGLRRYDLNAPAERIAGKYQTAVATNFEQSGKLWEKYDVTRGAIAGGEYPAQDMLGWTAGVYLGLG
jgi:alpha,alpha-trehalase